MKGFSKIFLLLSLCCIFFNSNAQNFEIGQRTETITDPQRSRGIPSEIFYPANQAGTNVAVANGNFPLIVFGHGFSMNFGAYYNFINYFVARGYIMVFPKTEVGPVPFPDHGAFGADMSFLVDYFQAQANNSNALFFQKINGRSAVMGHSMGGGCSFLAAEQNPNINVMATFAAAETNVSAISAAQNVSIPALVFSGSEDNVAPASGNQSDMYNNLASDCKYFISLNGGSHCGFGNSNTACDFGETTVCLFCSFISRADQHARTFAVLEPWLDFHLKQDCNRWDDFRSALLNTTDINVQSNCTYDLPEANFQAIGDSTFCDGDSIVLNTGSILKKNWSTNDTLSQITVYNPGQYFLVVEDEYQCRDTSRNISVVVNSPVPMSFNLRDTILCNTDSVQVELLGNFSNTTWNNQALGNSFFMNSSSAFQVQAFDANACKSMDTINITLSKLTAGFLPEIFAKPDFEACMGDTIFMSISDTFNAPFAWNIGDTAQSFSVSSSGVYFVERTDSFGCTYFSDTVKVSFNSLPTIALDSIGDSLFVSSSFATLDWFFNDSILLNQYQNLSSITVDSSGFYNVLLTDSNGCSAESSSLYIEIPEVIDTTVDTTINSIRNSIKFQTKIYPNPVRSTLNIESTEALKFQIIDMTGKSLAEGYVYEGKNRIELDFIPAGIYNLMLYSEEDIYFLKLVKR